MDVILRSISFGVCSFGKRIEVINIAGNGIFIVHCLILVKCRSRGGCVLLSQENKHFYEDYQNKHPTRQ